MALYDDGRSLRLLPALSPGALEEDRTPEDDASPWLSFQALIDGSDALLRDYPQPELKAVRDSFAEAKTAYLDRAAADRPERFAAATDRFAGALRAAAERIEPLRRRLPLLARDKSLIDATAYPHPNRLDAEVFYNRLTPFFWAWIVGICSVVSLSAAVGRLRAAAFWIGAALMARSARLCAAGPVAEGLYHRTGSAYGNVRIGRRRGGVRLFAGALADHVAAVAMRQAVFA